MTLPPSPRPGHTPAMRVLEKEDVHVRGRVTITHVATRDGREVPLQEALSPAARAELQRRGIDPQRLMERNNLVVRSGRAKLALLLRGRSSASINRVTLGDCTVGGIVVKDQFPADLSDVALVHEIRTLGGQPGAMFDIDEDTSPDEVTKVSALVGTPGTLTAGAQSKLADSGQNFIAAGVDDEDTITVFIGDEDYTLGIREVLSATEIEVDNPAQLAAAVGYSIQTPGSQALFRKLISGDNFPVAQFGPVTVVHEAGLLFTDGTLFNRVVFQPDNPELGLVLQPTDVDGTRIDVQLDWLITF